MQGEQDKLRNSIQEDWYVTVNSMVLLKKERLWQHLNTVRILSPARLTLIGHMDKVCEYGAVKVTGELPSMCCSNKQVLPDNIPAPPTYLHQLIEGKTDDSKHFLENIRNYNCAFQMTSFGSKEQHLPARMESIFHSPRSHLSPNRKPVWPQ